MSKLILGSSNEEYHANTSYLSSSSLKTLLRSPQQFEQEYILGNKQRVDKPAFVDGSLVHTLILEPEKISDYAVFPGMRKAGKVYETFVDAHKGKVIISATQMLRGQRLVKSYESLPVATALLKGTLSEHNMVGNILGTLVKARADAINVDEGIIIDVKTTSMPSDTDIFKQTVQEYMYHLSAALYCQIAFDTYGKLFDFYWLVLSKEDLQCHVYKASTETLSTGSALVTQALIKYKRCKESGIWLDEQAKISYDTSEYEIEVI